MSGYFLNKHGNVHFFSVLVFCCLIWPLQALALAIEHVVFQFVLTAAGTQAEQVIESVRRPWGERGPGKIQIFYAANAAS